MRAVPDRWCREGSQRKSRSSISIALICTTSRQIPVSASASQGPEKGDLVQVDAACELFLTASDAEALEEAANMAHVRQSRPDSGPGFPVQTIDNVQVVPSLQVDAACELFLTAGAAEALETAAESLLGLTTCSFFFDHMPSFFLTTCSLGSGYMPSQTDHMPSQPSRLTIYPWV